MKHCNTCDRALAVTAFAHRAASPDGLSPRCRECQSAYARRYREQFPDRIGRQNRRKYLKDSERIKERSRAWRRANRERASRRDSEWQRNNPEKVQLRNERWEAKNPGNRRERDLRRKARKRAAAGSATAQQIQARVDYYGGRCWMCGSISNEIDHVKPLAAGGSHWPANLRPACAPCNRRKSSMWNGARTGRYLRYADA